MRQKKQVFFIFFVFIIELSVLHAAETKDGYIRLDINKKGNFSLNFLENSVSMNYLPLFSKEKSSTSYFTINVNGKYYRLDESPVFKYRYERIDNNPALIYESSSLIVTIIFSPVRTISSPTSNGIKLNISITNKDESKEMSVGLRLLLDTYIGEKKPLIPFITNTKNITKETIIYSASGENYWISRNDNISLMGNIINLFNDDSKMPDSLHFANWQRLNNAAWKVPYHGGRSFNSLPYSIDDSAVCYYWNMDNLLSGATFKYTIYLTTEDTMWYNFTESPRVEMPTINIPNIEIAAKKESGVNNNADLLALQNLNEILRQFIAGEIFLNAQDLQEIEKSINKYSNP